MNNRGVAYGALPRLLESATSACAIFINIARWLQVSVLGERRGKGSCRVHFSNVAGCNVKKIVGVIDDTDLNHPQRAGSKYFQYESRGHIGVAHRQPCMHVREREEFQE